jgi:hypothetical protein
MKKLFVLMSVLLLTTGIYAGGKVEVFYFHYTRRCATCQAVETETLKILQQLYARQLKEGKLSFSSVNLDEKNSLKLAERCKADGQMLLIVNDNKRVDLTEVGFMYALNKQEKLKLALKKAIDPLLK